MLLAFRALRIALVGRNARAAKPRQSFAGLSCRMTVLFGAQAVRAVGRVRPQNDGPTRAVCSQFTHKTIRAVAAVVSIPGRLGSNSANTLLLMQRVASADAAR